MKNTLSIYGSHDTSATFIDGRGVLRVLEYERFVKQRYAMFSERFDHRAGIGTNSEKRNIFLDEIDRMAANTHGTRIFKTVLFNEMSDKDLQLLKTRYPQAEFVQVGHHESHAASAYHLSGFDDAVIFSVDGGGFDYGEVSTTKVLVGKNREIIPNHNININFGVAYGRIGCPISEVRPALDSSRDSLVYAGKVMGLCAYGNVRSDWVQPMKMYYHNPDLILLGNSIGKNLQQDSLYGQDSYDLAATSQYVFESLLMEIISTYEEDITNIVMTGGCALNVLFNQKLREWCDDRNVGLYVPPNPNDCGLSLGQFFTAHPEASDMFSVYNGATLLDKEILDSMVEKYNAQPTTPKEIAKLISQGNIVGIVQGDSEIGPRALGNRSIICSPMYKNMKEILNEKVKFREWFRPFAPVCREEDVDYYFDNAGPSEFMSYAPKVNKRYNTVIPAVTHADGTARLQTVTKEQHKLFYEILSEVELLELELNVPVILNTSFNIKGYPILTTIEDALYVLDNTQIDYVYIEGFLFQKRVL